MKFLLFVMFCFRFGFCSWWDPNEDLKNAVERYWDNQKSEVVAADPDRTLCYVIQGYWIQENNENRGYASVTYVVMDSFGNKFGCWSVQQVYVRKGSEWQYLKRIKREKTIWVFLFGKCP